MVTFEELSDNITYYGLNTYYNHPQYQYISKLYFEFVKTFTFSLPKTNFTTKEGSTILDNSVILNYGDLPCFAPDKQAYVDSWLTCGLFQLPFFLETIQFGYISMILVISILVISIFGGIKESYKWFLFNQAIWDLLVCYDFICQKPTMFFQKKQTLSCFYDIKDERFYQIFKFFGSALRDSIRFSAFIPIFLLAFSRFLALYFPFFYKRHFSSTLKPILFTVFFNSFFISLLSIRRFVEYVLSEIVHELYKSCLVSFCHPLNLTTNAQCYPESVEYFQCYNRAEALLTGWQRFSKYIPNILSPFMFSFSNIFAFLLFLKICFQLKYQLKHNRAAFLATIKIACVTFFQCFTMTLIFLITFFQTYLFALAFPFQVNLADYRLYKVIPPFLFFLQYYTTTVCFNLIRVFLDSFIVLTFLKGYSVWDKKVLKIVFLCFIKPKKAFKKVKEKFKNNNENCVRLFVKTMPNTVSASANS